jgi:hypothetical protein
VNHPAPRPRPPRPPPDHRHKTRQDPTNPESSQGGFRLRNGLHKTVSASSGVLGKSYRRPTAHSRALLKTDSGFCPSILNA